MGEYLAPGVYNEDNPNAPIIESVSASTGGFMGCTQRGSVGVPTFITSWNEYLTKFALGVPSPFMSGSDLAYSVYGFFQNGGKRCYILRVAGALVSVASIVAGETVPTIKAKDEGVWGNSLKVKVVKNADSETLFDVSVYLGTALVEFYSGLSNDLKHQDYWIDQINFMSGYLNCVLGDLSVTTTDWLFTGGVEGFEEVGDTDYISALTKFDTVNDLNLLCIPGETSVQVTSSLMSYCENRGDIFAILDAPKASTVASIRELRKGISCKVGALNFPWIRVIDPLSKTGKLRDCPTCGHAMGVYARTISERGVWKAPAGTEAKLRGAIEVMTTLAKGDLDVLNPIGIVSIIPKTNYGIVLWGARNLNSDSSMKYISDVLLDINIKKSVFNGTQSFVFEPNAPETWIKVKTTIESFLYTLWVEGALLGDKPSEAYFVKCDADLNTKEMRDQGKMICQIGYANKKPAEFVIFKFSHEVAGSK